MIFVSWQDAVPIVFDRTEAALIEIQGGSPSTPRLGPDLDQLVCERVLQTPASPDFHPSTQIGDAWKVHHHMDQMSNDVLSSYLSELHRILFARWRERTGARVIGPDTPGYLMELDPESICLAALKAMETPGS